MSKADVEIGLSMSGLACAMIAVAIVISQRMMKDQARVGVPAALDEEIVSRIAKGIQEELGKREAKAKAEDDDRKNAEARADNLRIGFAFLAVSIGAGMIWGFYKSDPYKALLVMVVSNSIAQMLIDFHKGKSKSALSAAARLIPIVAAFVAAFFKG